MGYITLEGDKCEEGMDGRWMREMVCERICNVRARARV